MSDNERSFEQLKYDLEKHKLEFEQQKYERDNTFFNKNFGVIITALVSAATIIVSGSGIWIGRAYNQAQLDNAKNQSDRNFSFDVAKLLLERQADINTDDTIKAAYARNIVIALFPNDLPAQISGRMRDLSNDPDVKKIWADGLVYAQSIAGTATVKTPTGTALTAEKLAAEFSQLRGSDKLAELNLILDQRNPLGLSDKSDLAIFLTVIFSETDFLPNKVESLNYSAQRLLQLWPRRISPEKANELANNPEKTADFVYANRMGNSKPGDAYKFRGRGYLMVTGRDAYARLGAALNLDLVENPELLLDANVNARAATIMFAKEVASKHDAAGRLDLVKTVIAIDGGIIDLDGKCATYERILKL